MSGLPDEKIREKCVRAFLDLAILARLRNAPLSGYEITILFVRKFGIIVSPSVVYSVLYSLERNGLVIGVARRRGRIYELTEEGGKAIEKIRNAIADMQNFIRIILCS